MQVVRKQLKELRNGLLKGRHRTSMKYKTEAAKPTRNMSRWLIQRNQLPLNEKPIDGIVDQVRK